VHKLAEALYKHRDEALLKIPDDVPAQNHATLLRLVRTIVIARDAYEQAKAAGRAPRQPSTIRYDGKRMTRLAFIARNQKCSLVDAANLAVDRLYQSVSAKATLPR
jgi:hypothetical protein